MSKQHEVHNAQIEYAVLGFEDHGIFSCSIGLVYDDGYHQSFGGYSLDGPAGPVGMDGRVGTAWGCEYIRRVMGAAGVTDCGKLKGQYVRVKRESGWNGRAVAIGHIVKDVWFEPKTDLDFLKGVTP